jgi:hypothetical protein
MTLTFMQFISQSVSLFEQKRRKLEYLFHVNVLVIFKIQDFGDGLMDIGVL